MEDKAQPAHPYHPLTASIPHYAPNETPVIQLLATFGSIVAAIVIIAYQLPHANARFIDRFSASWFALCGFLHVAFEGYYVFNRVNLAGTNALFAQLWKEYTLSDSRYLTLDVFTVCVESITVIAWGPLALITLLCIIKDHPMRHAFQVAMCTAHLYGVALYYSTNWLDEVSYSRPEVLYYWIYYIGLNAPWATVPIWLLLDSFRQIGKAFRLLGDVERHRKTT